MGVSGPSEWGARTPPRGTPHPLWVPSCGATCVLNRWKCVFRLCAHVCHKTALRYKVQSMVHLVESASDAVQVGLMGLGALGCGRLVGVSLDEMQHFDRASGCNLDRHERMPGDRDRRPQSFPRGTQNSESVGVKFRELRNKIPRETCCLCTS